MTALRTLTVDQQTVMQRQQRRIAELETATARQAAALKAANQARRNAELAVAAVTLEASTFDHTAKPTKTAKRAVLEVSPEALRHLNPETVVVVDERGGGTTVTATVKALG